MTTPTKSMLTAKKRHWAFVLYPESAPEDWLEQLTQTGLQGAVSPLHDRDVDPTGQPKKPHYHVILSYSGPTSYNVVKALTARLGQPVPQALEQVRGYYRYLTHKDNPEKAQYQESDIKTFGGFDIGDFVELSKSEVVALKAALTTLIREQHFADYGTFLYFVQDNLDRNSFDVAAAYVYLFQALTDTEWRIQQREIRAAVSAAATPPGRGADDVLVVVEEAEIRGASTTEEGENWENRGASTTETGASTTETGASTTAINTEAEPLVFWHCCPNCGSENLHKDGKTVAGTQRFQCDDCGKRFTVTSRKLQK